MRSPGEDVRARVRPQLPELTPRHCRHSPLRTKESILQSSLTLVLMETPRWGPGVRHSQGVQGLGSATPGLSSSHVSILSSIR